LEIVVLLDLSPEVVFFFDSFSISSSDLQYFCITSQSFATVVGFYRAKWEAHWPTRRPLIATIITTLSGIFGIYALIWMNLLKYWLSGSLICCLQLNRSMSMKPTG
jgi:hypothetical protein